MGLDAQIEALLFFKGEPIKRANIAKLLSVSSRDVDEALHILEERLKERGVRLMVYEDKVHLVTAPEMGETLEKLLKEELQKDLGKAGLETLTIILYRGPVTRAQIDYIRGVNSSYMLRHLLVRGLVEKVTNPDNARSFLYKPTVDLLGFLGIVRVEELPDYARVREDMHHVEENETDE